MMILMIDEHPDDDSDDDNSDDSDDNDDAHENTNKDVDILSLCWTIQVAIDHQGTNIK